MINNKEYDVLVVGDHCDSDIVHAGYLARRGLRCVVLRRRGVGTKRIKYIENLRVVHFSSYLDFIRYARKSRLVLSFAGLGKVGILYLSPIRLILRLPPLINSTYGSDITELVNEKSIRGVMYRKLLRSADLVWCSHYPNALKNIIRWKLRNVIFMRHPICSMPVTDSKPHFGAKDETVHFLHASNLDWKDGDKGSHRNSSKGNDRFIRSFAKAVANGLNADCVILERGPDVLAAKRLIGELDVEKYFKWKKHLTHEQLSLEISNADVVVDQFDVGGLGGIAFQSMSLAKPVMIYLQEKSQRVLYADIPPVLNCFTGDDIYKVIMKCQNKEALSGLGRRAEEWIKSNHHWSTCLDQFIFYYTMLTGHVVLDYGWKKSPYDDAGEPKDQR